MIFNRLHPLHLCSLVRRFSGPVRKFATRAARLVTVLTENPPARHAEFSLGSQRLSGLDAKSRLTGAMFDPVRSLACLFTRTTTLRPLTRYDGPENIISVPGSAMSDGLGIEVSTALSTGGQESWEQPCREAANTCSSSREYPDHLQILPT